VIGIENTETLWYKRYPDYGLSSPQGDTVNHPAWVEIDVDALSGNIGVTKELVGAGCKILLVVKADAYGLGAVQVSQIAERSGVSMLGVATVHEAIELREAGIQLPILVLSPTLKGEIPDLNKYDIGSTVSSLDFGLALSQEARASGRVSRVHVEVDTGMGRCGIGVEDALEFITQLSEMEGLYLEGVYTHFPSAHIGDLEFTEKQTSIFSKLIQNLKRSGIEPPLIHAANSGAILMARGSDFTMVRPGIMIYGFKPSGFPFQDPGLVAVMSFKCRVAQVRKIPKGHGISYGRHYVADRDMRVAVLPVGYGHGLSHRLSNNGDVLIRGKRAPIVGSVTMDVTIADITEIGETEVEDEVVVFGTQGEESISVEEVATRSGTISYEVITRISRRVPRVFVSNGKPIGLRTLTDRRMLEALKT
jgi:alanine racemase